MSIVEENEARVKEAIASMDKGSLPILIGILFCDRDIVDIYIAIFNDRHIRHSKVQMEVRRAYFEENVLTKRAKHER